MKKIIIYISIIISGLSFYFLCMKAGVSYLNWALVSFSPYILITAIAVLFKSSIIQSAMLPFLVFYGVGNLLNVSRTFDYIFAHVSAIWMLILSVFIVLRVVLKIKLIRAVIGIVIGVVLFFGIKIYKESQIDKKFLQSIPVLENKLVSFIIK